MYMKIYMKNKRKILSCYPVKIFSMNEKEYLSDRKEQRSFINDFIPLCRMSKNKFLSFEQFSKICEISKNK